MCQLLRARVVAEEALSHRRYPHAVLLVSDYVAHGLLNEFAGRGAQVQFAEAFLRQVEQRDAPLASYPEAVSVVFGQGVDARSQ